MSMEYNEPCLPPDTKLLVISNHSSLSGRVYNMWSFSTRYVQIYFILLFISEVMQGIKN